MTGCDETMPVICQAWRPHYRGLPEDADACLRRTAAALRRRLPSGAINQRIWAVVVNAYLFGRDGGSASSGARDLMIRRQIRRWPSAVLPVLDGNRHRATGILPLGLHAMDELAVSLCVARCAPRCSPSHNVDRVGRLSDFHVHRSRSGMVAGRLARSLIQITTTWPQTASDSVFHGPWASGVACMLTVLDSIVVRWRALETSTIRLEVRKASKRSAVQVFIISECYPAVVQGFQSNLLNIHLRPGLESESIPRPKTNRFA